MTAAAKATRTQTEFAKQHLATFATATPGVAAVVLTSGDGHEVAAHRVEKAAAAKLAAMGSSIQALGDALTREAGVPGLRNLVLEAEKGTVLVMAVPGARPRLTLAVVAQPDATLGHLLWSARVCCQALGRAFQQ
jgi:predicted regulator of Ras-like GTPase activity (Roadblock/LC7/MglB family)